MKPLSKRALLLGTAAIAFCAMTASVHAQTWNTDHTSHGADGLTIDP